MLAVTMLFVLIAVPRTVVAGEGGTAHILPGANATLLDLLPTKPGGFFKPMYLNYSGSVLRRSRQQPDSPAMWMRL